jgi:hypothetical protein
MTGVACSRHILPLRRAEASASADTRTLKRALYETQ